MRVPWLPWTRRCSGLIQIPAPSAEGWGASPIRSEVTPDPQVEIRTVGSWPFAGFGLTPQHLCGMMAFREDFGQSTPSAPAHRLLMDIPPLPKKLNRYTTLPVLLDLLRRKKIVLLDPCRWEDRNDAEIILQYKKRKKLKSLFAVCFGTEDETVHEWKAYADGISGCCIEFDGNELLKSFQGRKGFRWRKVKYKLIKEVQSCRPPLDDMPFLKRWPYRCENEFRILWEGESKKDSKPVGMDLRSIKKITLSPEIPDVVARSIRGLLRQEINGPLPKINVSTLYQNKTWIRAFKK